MRPHTVIARRLSPLAIAQRHIKEVARRNTRAMAIALVGGVIVITIACLALFIAAVRR